MRYNPICILLLLSVAASACTQPTSTAPSTTSAPAPAAQNIQSNSGDPELDRRLKTICDGAQGNVGLAIVHIESGKTISIDGKTQYPLYSVFKLPLAIAILKDVEENRLRVDQKIHVTPAEIVPGTPENTALWVNPVDRTIAELIDVSIARSDNTSSEKLLQIAGGPEKVTERMRALGFQNLDIHSTISDYVKRRENVNTGSADDLANLLAQLQQGKILQPAQQNLLIGSMQRTITGTNRLKGNLPAGTVVADKTGSGARDAVTQVAKATNDVGIITLPSGRGHLAIAVLVNESKLPHAAQEKLIADLARTAFDAYSDHSSQK